MPTAFFVALTTRELERGDKGIIYATPHERRDGQNRTEKKKVNTRHERYPPPRMKRVQSQNSRAGRLRSKRSLARRPTGR